MVSSRFSVAAWCASPLGPGLLDLVAGLLYLERDPLAEEGELLLQHLPAGARRPHFVDDAESLEDRHLGADADRPRRLVLRGGRAEAVGVAEQVKVGEEADLGKVAAACGVDAGAGGHQRRLYPAELGARGVGALDHHLRRGVARDEHQCLVGHLNPVRGVPSDGGLEPGKGRAPLTLEIGHRRPDALHHRLVTQVVGLFHAPRA